LLGEIIKVPPIIKIVGFLQQKYLASPECISQHTIILSKKKTSGKKKKKDKKKKKKKKIVKADACKADPEGSSFYELLHNSLMNMKVCGIVQFQKSKRYGYISVSYDSTSSGIYCMKTHY
jgi:hypothetical protein